MIVIVFDFERLVIGDINRYDVICYYIVFSEGVK